jgi:CrcB protein
MDNPTSDQDPSARGAAAGARKRAVLEGRATVYGLIGLGSLIGSELRWFVSLGAGALLGPAFPWATLFANVTGSFVIAFFSALTGPDGRLFVSARTRQFVMTGICGGYTTFSLFSLESLRYVQSGEIGRATLYLAASITTWLGAAWLGHALAMRLNRLKGA